MNFEKVQVQFGSWARPLRPFIESREMDQIFAFLRSQSQAGKVLCPHHVDVFRAFRECDYMKLKCVIVGQDPYPWIRDGSYAADGLAFSSGHTEKIEASLQAIYDGMEDDLCKGFNLHMHRNPDLTHLAHQGVLLLNSSLTTEQDVKGAHAPFIDGTKQRFIWEPLIKFVLDDVLNNYDRTIFVFVGGAAQRYAKIPVPFHHHVFEVEHPAAGSYDGGRPWKHQNIFSRVNHILKMNNGEDAQIKWFHSYNSEQNPC